MQKIVCIIILIVFANYAKGQHALENTLYSIGDSITDVDGNKYQTVIIKGKQWMTENLRVTHFNDGSEIEVCQEEKKYGTMSGQEQTPAYCWYKGKKDTMEITERGALYNWFTVETGKLCPIGWHVSTVEEWDMLEKLADPEFVSTNEKFESTNTGAKLRSSDGWKSGFLNWGPGSNDFGLSIKPGGYKLSGKYCYGIGNDAIFWTDSDVYLPTALDSHKGEGSGIKFLGKVSNRLSSAATVINVIAKTQTTTSNPPKKEKSDKAVSQKITNSITHNNDYKEYFYSIRCVKD
jgi:uncharacterized protein (TIGR02145 family)